MPVSTKSQPSKIRISIDRGGTFTDVHASVPGKPDIILKLLSVDPGNYQDAPTEGIRRVLELATDESFPRGKPLNLKYLERLRMGTTVATNALLERKGAKSALITTKGFKDLLSIGNQARPKIFDLSAKKAEVLYEKVVEINERIIPCPQASEAHRYPECRLVEGTTGEQFRILQELNQEEVIDELHKLWDEGYRSLAVALLHSYAHPAHEVKIGEIALSMGFSVALSSRLQPMIKVVPRGMSASADAYLTPVIKSYIDSIDSNFEGGLDNSHGCRFEFMQSDGGLVDFRNFSGLKAILSGPAAGVVGFAATSWDEQERVPVIGFDMGGTSTDVCRFDGNFEHVFGANIAGVSIQSPQLDINTVAAGGGSNLTWRNGLFLVGPESASAHPGPACYRKGGPLTVTDANLFLGRLLPEYFPKIFGPNENEPLDREITTRKFQELTDAINQEQRETGQAEFTAEEVALGFLKVADESMARPVRNLTEARGFETSSHYLASFGGAGGQHACSVAATLGISRIIIHKYSSVLSAYGLALADVVKEAQEPASVEYISSQSSLRKRFESMIANSTSDLLGQGFQLEQIHHQLYLNMRYEGSDTSLMILKPENWDFAAAFKERHRREFGFTFEKPLLVDDVRVRSIASSNRHAEKSPAVQLKEAQMKDMTNPPKETTQVYFETTGYADTPVYLLKSIAKNTLIHGPAIIIDETQTIVVAPDAVANVLQTCIVLDLEQDKTQTAQVTSPADAVLSNARIPIDPVRLSIFGHRFMSIAEQMGRTLQKTSVSTNIKERLDFSCALFSPDGGLVANAPHVPVHLGSMQFAVRYQHNRWLGQLKDGDVLVSNHPSCGGTHLPDITVITPVFDRPGGSEIVFYVASRGHHADIGGLLPGSMPPKSTELWQEGAAIEAEKIVDNGFFNESRMTEILLQEPANYDGCSGTRCLADNLSDLKAQIAANTRGIQLIQNLISEYGLLCVQAYMYAIQSTAETAVRNLLHELYLRFDGQPLAATDYMDDGTPISLKIQIDKDTGSAVFDFEGTGPEVYGNTNAPVAITHSAIIYCLRCMINSDIPLNQGCLAPITIKIPKRSLLSPSRTAAVVGGNVLTSQRITDVVLKAFRACAASQGDTNNLTFGTGGKSEDKDGIVSHVNGFGYYETIAGGGGAGPTWTGQSGVHTHMTNTHITDPEILEKRYPCVLRQFTLREGSGGVGANPGGDGVVREIEFLEPVQCSILSERRVHRPYGMEGGGQGKEGLNLWITKDDETGEERRVNLGGKNTVKVRRGDRVVVMTPGGGAWGKKEE
ncbi:5-oxoprolinase (ATP-hydrolysing) [Capronia coronata CBS 617.96]|uniref:5-oxoprolinase (ATP-hydrolysing) n=1 Tax=Capronia coronata CBS 617.96 TaxID=1182541 RepID=W9ZP51_9EURO|nr:5-oxoprolinase (ATP-hydrolyzing) [Capronia coronata CBS 617.96]EXJ96274.1 5-oxoprolinase (ATP-hydrolysing) [Capronia coronata CBS 617.96]